MGRYELAAAEYDGELIVGGEFGTAGGVTANGVAAWNMTTGACCHDDDTVCFVTSQNGCESQGFYYYGDFTDCGPPTPCNTCCQGATVGDVNCAGDPNKPDISDMQRMIDHLFVSMDPVCCLVEADVDRSGFPWPALGDVDIGDM